MKKRSTIFTGLERPFPLIFKILFCSIIFAVSSEASERVVVVGVYNNSPKVFIDESGEPAGIFVDIIKEIARLENWEIEYRFGTWAEGLEGLETGEIDLMTDVAYSSSRGEIFDYHSEPVLSDWFQIYCHPDSDIRSLVDLEGKKIVVLDRSVQQDAFLILIEDFSMEIELIGLPDYKAMFELVASGEVDAAVTNRFYGMMHAKEYGLEDTAIIFNPTKLYFAAPLGSEQQILDAIDERLIEMKLDAESVYYTALREWTSEDYAFQVPGWISSIAYLLGFVLMLSLAGSYILKRQVSARTKELRLINNEMECRIEKRTAELALAMEKAKSADRLKSAFLATMSHELRTPLNSIIGFTGILLQKLAGPMNDEQVKQMGMVQKSSRHLLELINDVLDISKIEAGELSLSYSEFDLFSSIKTAIDFVKPMAEMKQISLKADLPETTYIVFLDQRRLEQVLLNLINNAIKFTDSGFVLVSCVTSEREFSISVKDSGIGIKEGKIHDLFKPFIQTDTGLTRSHEGTGLGLSISSKLVLMMRGKIQVVSKLGSGSTFTFCIPRNRDNSNG